MQFSNHVHFRKTNFIAMTAMSVFLLFFLTVAGQISETKAAGKIPVILIHGIGGSDLRPTGKSLFNNGFPNDVLKFAVGDPYNLQFDSSGQPRADTISKNISAIGFYDVPGGKNITDLSKYLQLQGYVLNSTLFEFAYDFRYSVNYNAAELAAKIDQIKEQTKTGQVDIVGHSLGGMIAKAYLSNEKNAANVRALIFVGTPHLGAPKALKALRYGDNLDVAIIDGCKLKRVAHNLPGMYNLLPGKKYFDMRGGYFFDDDDLDKNDVRGLLDYTETLFNLKNGKETKCLLKPTVDVAKDDTTMVLDRLNNGLIDEEVVKFHDALDNWKKPANVTVFNIVGYGVATIENIRESGGKISYGTTTEGDGTVPLWSAETVTSDKIYYVNLAKLKRDHSQMIGDKFVDLQIYNLLNKGAGTYIGNLSDSRPSKKEFK